MIGDIMYELPLFGEWRVVRDVGAVTRGRGAAQGSMHSEGS